MNVENRIKNEKCRYSQEYLYNAVGKIFLEKCLGKRTIAFYGGGLHFQIFEKLVPIGVETIYCIDQRNINELNHIYPSEIDEYSLEIVIISSYNYRFDMQHSLEINGYKGEILDIYDELRYRNIWLKLPIYMYKGKMDYNSNILQTSSKSVEFYLVDAFEIYHFLPIYKRMLEREIDVRFIAEPNYINVSGRWFDWDKAVEILNEKHLIYDILCNPKADIAITTQSINILSKYYGRKARLSYGYALNKGKNVFQNDEKSIWGFDYIFVHGKYQEEITKTLSKSNQIIITMGFPKHIDFFNNRWSKSSILDKMGINTDKPVILCLPTWGNATAIDLFAHQIKIFRKDYYVITKMHHCTDRLDSEKNRKNILIDMSDLILDGNYNLEDAVAIADIVITDALSGASTEAPYLNKNIKTIYVYDNRKNDFETNCMDDIHKLGEVAFNEVQLKAALQNCDIDYTQRDTILEDIYGKRGYDCLNDIIDVLLDYRVHTSHNN